MSYKASDIIEILNQHPYIKILGSERLIEVMNVSIARYWDTVGTHKELLVVPDGYVGADGQMIVNEYIASLSNNYIEAYINSALSNIMASIGIYGVNMDKLKYAINVSVEKIRKLRKEYYKYYFTDTSVSTIVESKLDMPIKSYIFNRIIPITIET